MIFSYSTAVAETEENRRETDSATAVLGRLGGG